MNYNAFYKIRIHRHIIDRGKLLINVEEEIIE